MKKLLLIIFIFLGVFANAQNGKLELSTLLEISNSTVSNISNTIRPKGFTLQYARDFQFENTKYQQVCWAYGATYNEKSGTWSYYNSIAIIRVNFEKEQNTPKNLEYYTDDATTYNSFFETLIKLGYKKYDEWIDSESGKIHSWYENERTNKKICLSESSSGFKYDLSIFNY